MGTTSSMRSSRCCSSSNGCRARRNTSPSRASPSSRRGNLPSASGTIAGRAPTSRAQRALLRASSSSPRRSAAAVSCGLAARTLWVSSSSTRSTSRRSSARSSASLLPGSITARGSTKTDASLWERSWTMPRTRPALFAFTASTGRPPRRCTLPSESATRTSGLFKRSRIRRSISADRRAVSRRKRSSSGDASSRTLPRGSSTWSMRSASGERSGSPSNRVARAGSSSSRSAIQTSSRAAASQKPRRARKRSSSRSRGVAPSRAGSGSVRPAREGSPPALTSRSASPQRARAARAPSASRGPSWLRTRSPRVDDAWRSNSSSTPASSSTSAAKSSRVGAGMGGPRYGPRSARHQISSRSMSTRARRAATRRPVERACST